MSRHCPGCEGYTQGAVRTCPGMSMSEFETPDVIPPLRFGDRFRVFFGLTVFLGVAAEIVPPREDGPDPDPGPGTDDDYLAWVDRDLGK